ncbi:MAG: carboxypeptidase regulatory-like domain-containing protein [Flavobacteriales bacterium]|nr:carboxypeptidase regulatory-like domain-containing protein [Flavobacteriales bacterium]
MKTIAKITTLAVLIVATVAFVSCTKDPGFGGKKAIIGTVTLDGVAVEGADVNIAFDVTEATDVYNYTTVSDESGSYSFEAINPGSYYINATYMDDFGLEYSSPGVVVTVENKKDDLADVNLTVN